MLQSTLTLSATLIAERYRVERHIERGGMGSVWLARDDKLGRAVALKVMNLKLVNMPIAVSRFEREARAVAQLRSDHVVEVYDFGLHDGVPFIVMELLEGENLAQRMKRAGRLSIDECRQLMRQMCRGLTVAHRAGLVHRDLKPNNIFLARRDGGVIVKLLDFGVVKSVDNAGASEATATGILLGTPQYMSPEQASARGQIDHRSDLWSLGVLMFRALTGTNPFKGGSVGDVVLRICTDPVPQLADFAPELAGPLHGFFERAFQRDRERRFQSAGEMAQAFDTICHQLDESTRATVALPAVGAAGERLSTPTPWSRLGDADQQRAPETVAYTQVLPPTPSAPAAHPAITSRAPPAPPSRAASILGAPPDNTSGGTRMEATTLAPRHRRAANATLAGVVILVVLLGVASIWLAGASGDGAVVLLPHMGAAATSAAAAALAARPSAPPPAAEPSATTRPSATPVDSVTLPAPSAAPPPRRRPPRPSPSRPKWF